jgi:putative oxidoreductase
MLDTNVHQLPRESMKSTCRARVLTLPLAADPGSGPTHRWNACLAACLPAVLSLFRMVFGLLFLCHGLAHVFGWPAAAGPAATVGAWPMWWGGVLELVTGLLISVGLWTRAAAFVASGMMAYAFFVEHTADGILPIVNGGESAVLYCFGFLLLVFAGGGTQRRKSVTRSTKAAESSSCT